MSGSEDCSVKVWNIETGVEIATLNGHKGIVLSVAISPDSKIIASGSGDNSIKLWSLESGKEIKILK